MRKKATTAAETRRAKVRKNLRAFYARASYTVPPVALDRAHHTALKRYMKQAGIKRVSDAIRELIAKAGTASKPVKSRPARRSSSKPAPRRPARSPLAK